MGFRLRRIHYLLLSIVAVTGAFAQSSSKTPAHKPAWKQYCQAQAGFCFRYPAAWSVAGEVFDGNGVVIAPAQKTDDEITVAMIIPPPAEGEDAVGIDQLIEQTMESLRQQGRSPQTLQRQERTVDAKPAQMLKIQYHDKETNRDWLEELVFIEGPDSEVYSVALKCAPQSAEALQPVMSSVVQSWKLPKPVPPAELIEPQSQPSTSAKPDAPAPHP